MSTTTITDEGLCKKVLVSRHAAKTKSEALETKQ